MIEPTDEQLAIRAFIQSGQENLLISALAGSGKTTSLIDSVQHSPQKSVLMCAFNKGIATELSEQMGKAPPGAMWKAATFHSCGLRVVQTHRPRIDVRGEATEDLINDAAEQYEAWAISTGDKERRVVFAARRCAVRLLRTIKETCIEKLLSLEAIRVHGESGDAFRGLIESDKRIACKLVEMAYLASQDLKARRAIDFCDMTWLPVVLDLAPPSRYQIVFVDEAQDLSLPQLTLVKKLVAPKGRLIACGDLNQAIYKWRGAVGDQVWREMKEAYQAKELPLTTTFRCSKTVVKEANQLVPTLRAQPLAPEGSVKSCSFEELPLRIKADLSKSTFVLSRNNSDLLHTALYLWRVDVGFNMLAGREVIEPLYDIIDKLDKSTKDRFSAGLTTWHQAEMAKAESAHATVWADRVEQQHSSLVMMLGYAEPHSFKNILQDILFSSSMSTIQLSTVHKVKGLEADRVFLLKQTFERHRRKQEVEEAVDDHEKQRALDRLSSIDQEELNLEYVAITRAKADLIWVDMRGATAEQLARVHNAARKQ